MPCIQIACPTFQVQNQDTCLCDWCPGYPPMDPAPVCDSPDKLICWELASVAGCPPIPQCACISTNCPPLPNPPHGCRYVFVAMDDNGCPQMRLDCSIPVQPVPAAAFAITLATVLGFIVIAAEHK